MRLSLNNNLIVKPYKKAKQLEANKTTTGFVTISNKINLIGLELLVDANIKLSDNSTKALEKGSIVYFKEETLHSIPWARQIFETEEFSEGFIIADSNYAVYVEDNR